jgi:argininosuccinate synthase
MIMRKGNSMDVKAILKKVEEATVPQVKKVAVAYSGGLDSRLGIEMLRRKYKAQEIVAICIDVGQGGKEKEKGTF